MYIVEGNIGVGKTTFLSLVKQNLPEVEVLAEPVDDWSEKNYGQSLLENFYQETSRWAYTLETLTMICRTRDHIQEQEKKNPCRLFERSIYSGHYCFARNSFETGHMTKLEWNIYNQWANFLLHKQCEPPLGFIYLKASPKKCFDRVQVRNRQSEKSLSLEYIEQIDFWHNQFLVHRKGITPQLARVPVLVIDCNVDFVKSEEVMGSHISRIKSFFTHTQNPLTSKGFSRNIFQREVISEVIMEDTSGE